jgi:hypothetical protein
MLMEKKNQQKDRKKKVKNYIGEIQEWKSLFSILRRWTHIYERLESNYIFPAKHASFFWVVAGV